MAPEVFRGVDQSNQSALSDCVTFPTVNLSSVLFTPSHDTRHHPRACPPPHSGHKQVKADAIRAEEALASELKNILQSPASLPLPILRRCVELVMTAHRGRGSLAGALGSVSRAEVLGEVLRKGGELSEAEGADAAAEWAALQAEFIAMAKEAVAGGAGAQKKE